MGLTNMTTMRRLTLTVALFGSTAAFFACSSQRAFTRGTYADPNEIEMLSDQFSENDLQLIAKKMVTSLSASKTFANIQGRPVIVVGKMKNSTSEHIDMRSLADKIQVQLAKTEKFAFVDKGARE